MMHLAGSFIGYGLEAIETILNANIVPCDIPHESECRLFGRKAEYFSTGL
jgi:hypothetical protein